MPVQRVYHHTGGSENYITEQEHTKPRHYTAARHKAIQHAHIKCSQTGLSDRWPLSCAISAGLWSHRQQGTLACNNLASSFTAQFTLNRLDTSLGRYCALWSFPQSHLESKEIQSGQKWSQCRIQLVLRLSVSLRSRKKKIMPESAEVRSLCPPAWSLQSYSPAPTALCLWPGPHTAGACPLAPSSGQMKELRSLKTLKFTLQTYRHIFIFNIFF